jgi:membrane associated rhomboid family serine protease
MLYRARMILPLGIEHPYRRTPVATWGLLAASTFVFVLQLIVGASRLDWAALHTGSPGPHQFITYGFLHAGLFHLLGNMLMLWVYGRYVEERLGPKRYLIVYGSALVAGGIACLFMPDSKPTLESMLAGDFASGPPVVVGASGAIAGLFGLVLVTAPWAQVRWRLFLWPFFLSGEQHMAAFFLLVPWLLLELFALPSQATSGIAILAHVGGFAAGAAIGLWCRQPAREGTGWWIDPALPGGGKDATKRLGHARGSPVAPKGPTGEPREGVRIEALPKDASRVAVMKLLVAHAGVEPDDGMRVADAVARGEPQEVWTASREAAEALLARLTALEVRASALRPPVRVPSPR